MLKLAVIGSDVSKSQSPELHAFLLGRMGETCIYDKVSISPRQFSSQVGELFQTYDAFNVTIPYKQMVLKHLRELSAEANALGAVNTVLCSLRKGFNTDEGGFGLMLESANADLAGKNVLVLGAGGAGRSCIFRLKSLGAKVFVYEKDEARLNAVYKDLNEFTPLKEVLPFEYACIVNCTGVGMHESEGELPAVRTQSGEIPFPDALFKSCTLAVDLIYEPQESAFLKQAKACGIRAVNGFAMLFYQAYLSDCIYLQKAPNLAEAKAFYEQYQKENL